MNYICVIELLKLWQYISDNIVTTVNSNPTKDKLSQLPARKIIVFQNLLKVNNTN